jgi:hypothetical protein
VDRSERVADLVKSLKMPIPGLRDVTAATTPAPTCNRGRPTVVGLSVRGLPETSRWWFAVYAGPECGRSGSRRRCMRLFPDLVDVS